MHVTIVYVTMHSIVHFTIVQCTNRLKLASLSLTVVHEEHINDVKGTFPILAEPCKGQLYKF